MFNDFYFFLKSVGFIFIYYIRIIITLEDSKTSKSERFKAKPFFEYVQQEWER